MRMMKLSASMGGGALLALAVASFGLVPTANSSDLVYENDFAVRTSAENHSSVWATYTYDKGGPVAYDYDGESLNFYTGMYPWQTTAVTYSQQDGWTKKYATYANRYINRGYTSVTDEADPALVHSAKAVDAQHPATNLLIAVLHPLRNVFTNGVVKVQFDIRQPVTTTSKIYSWLRLVTENDMKNDNASYNQMPIELGASSTTLSGGWRKDGDADGKRTFNNYTARRPVGGNWYRYYVTCDLDTSRSSFEAYDLGTSRISMDAIPSGDSFWSGSNLLFVKELTAETGGISGIGIRLAYVNTEAYYGEARFDYDCAYMYDNIKVAWKAPGAASFSECYRNDFSKSMRRTIDGRGSTYHAYTLPAEDTETSTFTYPDELLRASNVGSQTGKPYLPAAFGSGDNEVKPAGIDGWRFVGQTGGFKGAIALTTNGANRVGMLTKYAQVIQPMCEDITNGLVKMEWDMRMPKAWNTSYARSSIILTNNKGYDEGYEFAYEYRLLSLGFCSTTGSGNSTSPVTTYSVLSSSPTSLWSSWNAGWASKFKANEWYRFQLFVDLDKTNYWFRVYDIGAAAPSTPDSFDSSDPANALVSGATNGLYNPTGINAGKGFTKHGLGIGAYGFVMWNNPDSDAGYAMLVDNVRCWKGDGNDGWDLVFQNTFSTTTRTFKRKKLNLLKTSYIDRPEYGEDGWAAAPTYVGYPCIAGSNPSLYSGDEIFSLVHPIGRHIRSGKLYAQYDMRVPVFWTSRMNYFWFQFGNGALASASTWTVNAYRMHSHKTIRTGMQRGSGGSGPLVDANTGVPNRTAIIYQDGTGAGGDGSLKAKHIDGTYVGHWIRVKVEADMNAKTWNWASYDMGTTQPTLATADGTLLDSYDDLHFNFNEPISHIHLLGGRAPSYMPWRADAPGALMVDNISIRHDPSGMVMLVK
ncbi:MAG: hypothetical protein IKE55_10805 [Kiritimatiellae bacterium]|nr:hypothetical protein [Kiritimatiellia bacterium]